jgi:hypothetical protein
MNRFLHTESVLVNLLQVTHWQSPYMHAYFPALNSFPSLLGDMLADAINCLGFTWVSTTVHSRLSVQYRKFLMTNDEGGKLSDLTPSARTKFSIQTKIMEYLRK